MRHESSLNATVFALLAGWIVVTSFILLALPLWFLAFSVMPILLMVALSVKTEFGTIRFLNILLCVYVLIFPIWPHYSALKIGGLPAINPQRITYLLIMLTWFFGVLSSPRQRYLFSARAAIAKPELFLLGTLLLWQFLSCFQSSTTLYSLFIFFRESILNVLILFSVMSFVRGEDDVKKVIRLLAWGAAVVATLTIVEGVLKRNVVAALLPVTSDYELWATAERIRGGSYRAQATFDNPLLLVDFLSLAFPAAIYLWRASEGRVSKLVGFGATLMIPAAMLLSGSRSAVIVLVAQITAGIGFLALRRLLSRNASVWPYFVMLSLLLTTATAAIALPGLFDIVTGRNLDEVTSTSVRLAMIRRGLPLIGAEPLFGYGLTQGAGMIGISAGSMYVLDNYFLTVGLDSGLPALLGFVGLMVLLLRRASRLAVAENDSRSPLAMTLLVGLIGFLVVKVISSQTQVFPLMFVVTGLLLALSSPHDLSRVQYSRKT